MASEEYKARMREYMREYYKRNREKIIARVREYAHTDKGREVHRNRPAQKRGAAMQKLRHADRRTARMAVKNAVRDGRLVPQPCFICGGAAEAHHSSYAEDMRLIVTWLCQPHHNEVHNG